MKESIHGSSTKDARERKFNSTGNLFIPKNKMVNKSNSYNILTSN